MHSSYYPSYTLKITSIQLNGPSDLTPLKSSIISNNFNIETRGVGGKIENLEKWKDKQNQRVRRILYQPTIF
jgi:hypothetical protein